MLLIHHEELYAQNGTWSPGPNELQDEVLRGDLRAVGLDGRAGHACGDGGDLREGQAGERHRAVELRQDRLLLGTLDDDHARLAGYSTEGELPVRTLRFDEAHLAEAGMRRL